MTEIDQAEPTLESVDPPPFIRITGTYEASDGQVQTISLDMNLDDNTDLAAPDGGDGEVRSWFTDFCTCVIAALRRPEQPLLVTMTGSAARAVAARLRHAEDCDGTCGLTDTAGPAEQERPAADPREANGTAEPADQPSGTA